MNKLNDIKNKIHIANPNITDETLDLLYEYVAIRLKKQYSIENMSKKIKDDKDFSSVINKLILNK